MRIMSQSLIVSMVIESSVRMLALTFEGLCTPSQNFLTSCSGFGTPTYSISPSGLSSAPRMMSPPLVFAKAE